MMIRFRIVLFFIALLFTSQINAQQVGLVLSGGGAKAFSHIGVLRALEENEVPIDYIVGNSMGALIGGLYAAGYSPDEIQAMLSDPGFIGLNKISNDEKVCFYQHQEPNASFLKLPFYIKNGLRFDLPFKIYDLQYVDFKMMTAFAGTVAAANCSFDSLMIPYRCVASDIDSAQLVVLRAGNLAKSIRSSMTFPLFIRPVELDGKMLFDGGMYNNFPVDVARDEFDPDFIIGSKAVRNFSKANPDDVVSLLQNMLMQKADYSIDSLNGVLVETISGDESIFHFSRLNEYVDSGYVAAIRAMPEIKKKLPHAHSRSSISELRKKFNARKPMDSISEVKFSGINSAQKQYFNRILGQKKKTGFNLETIDSYFVKLHRNENVKSVYPVLEQDSGDSTAQLRLEMTLVDPLSIDVGVYISSAGVNEGFVGLDYMQLGKTAKHLSVSTNFGTFYNSIAGLAKIEFPAKLPFILQMNLLGSRKNYFSNARYFFEDEFPAYIISDENYVEVAGIVPSGRDALFTLGMSNLNMNFLYYQDNYFSRSDTADISNFYFFTPFLEYEYNTLNRKQYSSFGKHFLIGLSAYFGNEHTIPGSKSDGAMEIKGSLNFYCLNIQYQQFWQVITPLTIGLSLDMNISDKPLLSNYLSSLLLSTPFEPLVAMKTKFLANYRAQSFGGLGVTSVFSLRPQFDIRLESYYYIPYQKILLDVDGKNVKLGQPFSNQYYAASVQLVYHPPMGVISASINYLEQPGSKFGFLLNLGYLIFNKSRFYR